MIDAIHDDVFDSMVWDVPADTDEETHAHELKPIYTADLETDPFIYGRIPKAFCSGFYDGTTYRETWGKNCIAEMLEQFYNVPPGIIYFHNGGKFDFYFFLSHFIGNPLMIINGRIIKAKLKCATGYHEIRDSLAILPFALKNYKKDEIDYNKFEEDVREQHKTEILEYLKDDCIYLHELCSAFNSMFGPKLTIGGTSMKELKKVHRFECLGPITDSAIRKDYYYGGRVQCFETGIIKGNWKVYDVNSMYPFVMRDFLHPVGLPEGDTKKIRSTTCFISAEGKNYGAFPQRTKEGLRFDIEDGIFHVSIHEWETAIRHDLFKPQRILRCINFRDRATFETFVTKFYNLRNEAKNLGDDIHSLFYKYILNSAYGKFAQNPEGYFDYEITTGDETMDEPWSMHLIFDAMGESENGYIIWKKPSAIYTRYNVATACSITGAARSVLLEAIAQAKHPIYCDTDSIVCESMDVPNDSKTLGAWKLEAEAHTACIAGKKLYALFSNSCPDCKKSVQCKGDCRHPFHKDGCVKQANKGVRISANDIQDICNGGNVEWFNAAPSFKLDGDHRFIHRNIEMRGN